MCLWSQIPLKLPLSFQNDHLVHKRIQEAPDPSGTNSRGRKSKLWEAPWCLFQCYPHLIIVVQLWQCNNTTRHTNEQNGTSHINWQDRLLGLSNSLCKNKCHPQSNESNQCLSPWLFSWLFLKWALLSVAIFTNPQIFLLFRVLYQELCWWAPR
jgi:hypothetical protein